MDLATIEQELKKRLVYPYQWGRKQNNYFDKRTNFIYQTERFDTVIKEIDARFAGNKDYQDFFHYALNRWFNFWSACAVEHIFCSCKGVTPTLDSKDRLVDFSIQNIKFDHKTSVYPTGYTRPIEEAKRNPGDLIEWFYKHQSRQQRHHLNNRIFIVLFSNEGQHWKLKAEIFYLKKVIEEYVSTFDERNLFKFSLKTNIVTVADIIFAIK